MRFFFGLWRASFWPSLAVFSFLLGDAGAKAEVVQKAPQGFVVRTAVEVGVSPETVWSTLIAPSGWWSPEHSFSGSAANFSLNLAPGGCFCEKLPARAAAKAGGVVHMQVVYFEPGRVLRLTGAIGPLQSEAVNGVWTITLKNDGGKTRVLFEYVVGGFMRYTTDQIAPVVDKVLTSQLLRLAGKVDPSAVALVRSPSASSPPSVAEQGATLENVQIGPSSSQAKEVGVDLAPLAEAASLAPVDKSDSVSKLVAELDSVMGKASLPARPAVSAASKSAAYVYREAVVQKSGGDFLLVDEASTDPSLKLTFSSPSGEARFRKEFAELSGSGATVICQCTGRIEDKEKVGFQAIDAKLLAR